MLKLDEDFLKRMNAPQIDLDEEYKKALKNENFKEMVKELNLDEEILKKYTTNLMECANDYSNCKTCPNIMECKNKVRGYAYLPTNIDNHIEFGYKSCKYLNKLNEENKYSDNVTLIGANSYLKNARMKDIYTDDKSRFNCIKWLNNFIKSYPNIKKGLYLNGNFGCGKSYLIAATFNELAKKNVKSAIIFWPHFISELKISFNGEGNFNYLMSLAQKTPLLLIDDIGAENLTDWIRDEILCTILNTRMEASLPTFFTSNLNIKMLEEHLSTSKSGVDKLKAKRIIERIKQLSENMEMIGENYRSKQWKDK